MEITLRHMNGSWVPVHSKKSDTVRSLLVSAGIPVPQNCQLICVSRGNQLHLDLSLGIQGIKENDTIFVLCQKNNNLIQSDKNKIDFESYKKTDNLEKQQKELFEEALRVSDLSFLLFDYYQPSSYLCDDFLKRQVEACYIPSPCDEETVIDEKPPDKVISDPLPVCWESETSDSEFYYDETE
ncbi:hypothetical protein GPJ56_004696 [Histomonas meleagridis]|uniref:uncharacterized protein n=1 Tax=Histomonas meleagridis TaxID=135588 RepID=UPI003559B5D9|nr:hypothetical protein GPJ56_004696 [Histomonas meleagridis]KAH0803617.1 hypothetical protein GO595_003582 [Histomonas meleagridis]